MAGIPGLLLNMTLIHLADVFFEKNGAAMLPVVVFSFIARETVSFITQKKWVFKTDKKESSREVQLYAINSLVIVVFSSVLFIYATENWKNIDVAFLPIIIGIITVVINIPVMFKIIFKK